MGVKVKFPLAELAARIDGEVLSDTLTRLLYATDASPYGQRPLAVVRPRHREDCVALMEFAVAHGVPVIPRAAGTSLAGQCVGEGLVVDFARHMNRIVEIDTARRRARVEPGVICDDLNRALACHGLMFAPDPSTASRCTVGGMLGNNAWGVHAPRYGTTREHVLSADAVLGDSRRLRLGAAEGRALQDLRDRTDVEGRIYGTVFGIVERHRELILNRFPRPDGICRNAGYPLDVLALGQPWEASGPAFNPARLLCGSEGTLALVTEMELNLVPRPAGQRLVCVHYRRLEEALEDVALIADRGPAALELVDRAIFDLTAGNLEQRRNRFWLQGRPEAVLLVEFQDDGNESCAELADALIGELRRRGSGYAHVTLDPPRLERAWALRAAGLGLLMGTPGRAKPATGIEDCAVPMAALPAYVGAVKKMLARHGTTCGVYGPAGRGVLHLRPLLDLGSERDRRAFARILEETADLVQEFGGAFTAKHGDGRLRGPFLVRQLGAQVVDLLRQIKTAFDPLNLLNPGKLFGAPPPTDHLRSSVASRLISTCFDWHRDFGLNGAARNCNGAGVCLKSPGRGTMCPSYMATREEMHGTRGRANMFRQMMEDADDWSGAGAERVREVLDCCLSCKGCKAECPANVDMARMKAEFLQHYYDRTGVPRRARLVATFDRLTRLAALWPDLANFVLKSRHMNSLLGFHPLRPLPALAKRRFSHWVKRHLAPMGAAPRGEVVLFNDLFSEFYEPGIAIAACRVLESLGWQVLVTPCLTSGRIQISQGLVRKARRRLGEAVERLHVHAAAGRFIVGLEPSEILTFRDEAVDLLETPVLRQKARGVAERALLFEEFIVQELESLDGTPLRPFAKRLDVHVHCHQKALVGTEPTRRMLQMLPGIDVHLIPSGCCGMAGAFGYEKEHFSLSRRIAELVLFPALRKAPAGSLAVATGISCRHQIGDGLGMAALHPAEVLCIALAKEAD